MAQPSFVPVTEADQVRPTLRQADTTHVTGRPSEMRTPDAPHGTGFGKPGPDQGFALRLAHLISERMVLVDGEVHHDVEVGAALVGARRASLWGRAPSVYDLEVALGFFGYLGVAPADLVAYRGGLFQAVGHSWMAQRALVDSVPEAALRLTPAEAAASSSSWRTTLEA